MQSPVVGVIGQSRAYYSSPIVVLVFVNAVQGGNNSYGIKKPSEQGRNFRGLRA
jgi:hypothetical protein